VKEDTEALAEKENVSIGSGSDCLMYRKDLPPEILNFFRKYAYALIVRQGNSICIDPEVLIFLWKTL